MALLDAPPLSDVDWLAEIDLARDEARRLTERYGAVRAAFARMRRMDQPAGVLAAMVEEVTRCGFRRACLTRVDGPTLSVVAAHGKALPPLPTEPVALVPETGEAEAIRRRRTMIFDGRGGHGLLGAAAHAVAPLMVDARVVGVLHADHGGRPLTDEDCDVLALFAEAAGHIVQRVELSRRLDGLRRQIHGMTESIGSLVDESCWAAVEIERPAAPDAPPAPRRASAPSVGSGSRLASLLTGRELEVLQLMAAGETNRAIAERLVIAEGTVKSHVKHILRKLHASNRAQAISQALRILHAGK